MGTETMGAERTGTVKTFLLPDLGEGLTEAELLSWSVGVGDTVTLNQIIAEVETAKAMVELPSPYAGTVLALHAAAGTTVDVGKPLIDFEVAEETGGGERVPVLVGYGVAEEAATRRRVRSRQNHQVAPAEASGGRPLAAPPVRFAARRHGIDLADVVPTGARGEVTRVDLERHLNSGSTAGEEVPEAREVRTPVKGVRKHTADAMVRSAFTAPHVTVFVDVDVTPTVELIEHLRASTHFAGVRLTPLALVAKALLVAVRSHPSLNSAWDEAAQEIVTKHYVNLGIAAATPRGLMVPNIKDAHTLGLRDLAVALSELTSTTKEGKTPPADLSDGTITITNIGVFGIDTGTPILNPGEAAILCVGAIRRRPWEYRGEVALRSVTTLGLSFDHRLADGEQGSKFLADIAAILADPLTLIAFA
ncbi:dihydrolipoamide acetyltransferase family protein [Mycolicibacterium diernhoferi]|nr:dihydrolipoamide acetyltransferase family protein [Mycolicibacterium diernhoferi]